MPDPIVINKDAAPVLTQDQAREALRTNVANLQKVLKDAGVIVLNDELDDIEHTQYGPQAPWDPVNFPILTGQLLDAANKALEQGRLDADLTAQVLKIVQTVAPLIAAAGLAAMA